MLVESLTYREGQGLGAEVRLKDKQGQAFSNLILNMSPQNTGSHRACCDSNPQCESNCGGLGTECQTSVYHVSGTQHHLSPQLSHLPGPQVWLCYITHAVIRHSDLKVVVVIKEFCFSIEIIEWEIVSHCQGKVQE